MQGLGSVAHWESTVFTQKIYLECLLRGSNLKFADAHLASCTYRYIQTTETKQS